MVALAGTYRRTEPSFERRFFYRQPVRMLAEARRLDHCLEARRTPRLSLRVRDVSVGGMSALSEQPVGEGERMRVSFRPSDGSAWWDAFGRVVRCDSSPLGYHVAVEFESLPAA